MGLGSLHLYAPYQTPPEIMDQIQALRARCYAADGVPLEDPESLAYDEDDSDYHVVSIENAEVVGCISVEVYEDLYDKKAEVHSWAIDPTYRKKRIAIWLALSCFALADMQGLNSGAAYATDRNGSDKILVKLGGVAGESRYDEEYGCNMRLVWFSPGLLSGKHKTEMLRVKERLTQSQIERLCW